jgi:3-methyladenine DNA glycosylase AlkD
MDPVMAGARAREIVDEMRRMSRPEAVEGARRYGTAAELGVTIPELRSLAKKAGRDHELSVALWSTGIHEARLLATMVGDPSMVTEEQAERWVLDLRSWDLCDQWCNNLLRLTPLAWPKTTQWALREEEMVRRAGYVLMAVLAVHDRQARDADFEAFIPLIEAGASDERKLVRKAVSWALRQIGKRDPALNAVAIASAERLSGRSDAASRRLASEALRELRSEAVGSRMHRLSKHHPGRRDRT